MWGGGVVGGDGGVGLVTRPDWEILHQFVGTIGQG